MDAALTNLRARLEDAGLDIIQIPDAINKVREYFGENDNGIIFRTALYSHLLPYVRSILKPDPKIMETTAEAIYQEMKAYSVYGHIVFKLIKKYALEQVLGTTIIVNGPYRRDYKKTLSQEEDEERRKKIELLDKQWYFNPNSRFDTEINKGLDGSEDQGNNS